MQRLHDMALKKLYAIYMFFFINSTTNKKTNAYLFLLRAVSVFGVGLFWVSLNSMIDTPPKFNDSNVSKGTLLKVTNPGPRAGYRNITIESGNGKEEFRTYANKKATFLKDKIGTPIIVWSYPYRDMFFIKRNKIIEIEADKSKVFNNWTEVKERIEDNKSIGAVLWGVVLMLFPLFTIYRLVTRNP
jgi:hypothetical protein